MLPVVLTVLFVLAADLSVLSTVVDLLDDEHPANNKLRLNNTIRTKNLFLILTIPFHQIKFTEIAWVKTLNHLSRATNRTISGIDRPPVPLLFINGFSIVFQYEEFVKELLKLDVNIKKPHHEQNMQKQSKRVGTFRPKPGT